MIFDKLENASCYYGLHKDMEKAFDFIKKAVSENLPVGKYEIDGTNVYASVQEYATAPAAEKKFEGHRKYLDIQFIVSGNEAMQLAHISNMTKNTDYNDEKDVEFYENTDNYTKSVVSANGYGIFLPQDIHKPGLEANGTENVKKILVKIKL